MLLKLFSFGFLLIAVFILMSFTERGDNEINSIDETRNELEYSRSESFYNYEKDSSNIPDEIISESSAGTVTFPHLYHYDDEGIECVECHHEMNAENLEIPHEDYFNDFWIDCNSCHSNNVQGEIVAHACSDCHHSHPSSIADEMISKKVAIHKNCWECHEAGTGIEASESCEFCHEKE